MPAIQPVMPSKLYKFYINNSQKNQVEFKYKDNKIDTTKYNVFTFLPKALFFQFIRLANIYFLIIAVIQCIPIISPLTWTTAVIPLLFVLCISLIREGVEDCQRSSLDKEQNSEVIEVFRNGQWQKGKSGELEMGEIVEVKQDGTFPADLVLIDSCLSEGICFIETGSLDGEKTLKQKQSPTFTKGKFNTNSQSKDTQNIIPNNHNGSINGGLEMERLKDNKDKEVSTSNVSIKISQFNIEGSGMCDHPNAELYQLNGKMKLALNGSTDEFPLDAKQLLLKGAKLRNTEWCIGIVIYTGHNCKLMKNAKNPLIKYSHVESLMSMLLIAVLIFQTILSIIAAILHGQYYTWNVKINPFTDYDDLTYIVDSVIAYFTYILLLNTMIPISLIVTLEIVKVIQGLFISVDAEGYSKIRQKLIKCNSVSLNEELGMVNYIFSDKTGTLTCNKMAFKFCVIGDVCYEYIRNDFETNRELREKEDIIPFNDYDMVKSINQNGGIPIKNLSIHDGFLVKSSTAKDCSISLVKSEDLILEYWKALALCHDCTIQNNDYIGMSPDSIELVKTSKVQGFTFDKCENNAYSKLKIGTMDKSTDVLFDKLNLIEFSSDRKRETVVVRDNKTIKLYIKGADSIIEERLGKDTTPKAILDRSKHYVNLFSSQGYRTLFIGMKVLSEAEYQKFKQDLESAMLDTDNKKEKVNQAYASVECNITLIGATIVEDKLQEKVPDTIKDLRLAGIKIWMLTGDKMNTAYNIALSCNLISSEMRTFFIEGKEIKKNEQMEVINQEEREKIILDFAKEYNKFKGNYNSMTKLKFGLLVDEKALLTISESFDISRIFLEIAKDAVAVICCRVSPLQKSLVVKMMKNYDKKAVTLAIGDGGNDVSMIMEAHIGIGIYGEEGMRAVQSSDYAIGEFKILRQLLLYHGRLNLIRNSEMVLYFFYKNFVFTIIHFFYGFYNNFSGQTIIDDWFITLFNLLFTSLPLGARAIIDFDVIPEDGKMIEKLQPMLYSEERDNPTFSKLQFVISIIRGTIQAIINYFWCIYTIGENQLKDNGDYGDIWVVSVNMYTNLILIVSVNLIINTRYHTWVNFGIIAIFTMLAIIIFFIIVHYNIMFNSVAVMGIAFGSCQLWINMFFVVGFCSLIDLTILFYTSLFSKRTIMILMRQRAVRKPDEFPECLTKRILVDRNETDAKEDIKSGKNIHIYAQRELL